jgi:hypothetical protein
MGRERVRRIEGKGDSEEDGKRKSEEDGDGMTVNARAEKHISS